MHTLHHKMVSLVFTLIAVPFFVSCANSQNQPPMTVGANRGPLSARECTPAGKPQPFARNNDDLRIAVLTQPVPELWLEFADSNREGQSSRTPTDEKEPVIRVALTPEAREILKSFWGQSLEFNYKEVFDKATTA